MKEHHSIKSKITTAGLLVTLGIVFGDIGTSPLYVMQAITHSGENLNAEFIYGALSCIIWTLTLQTTIKYVLITLKADNDGEGGILALYALIKNLSLEKIEQAKRSGKLKNSRPFLWYVFLFAIIGASALIADGIITPSITVVSAVEGLQHESSSLPILPIALVIIFLLFATQRYGTEAIGKLYGPVMFFWFLMLAVLGISQIVNSPSVLYKSLNPYYALHFITQTKYGFLLLGAVFLATTGAEALYSDLGHCGFKNIRITWVYVKITLILNYMGQGAWIIKNFAAIKEDTNPFYMMMPHGFLIFGIILATLAAVIASQALISGSFTIFSEAIPLNFWPRLKIFHPTNFKGQMYVPFVNWLLFFGCIFVVLYFRESKNIEAAYGLAITITMIMTTILMSIYFYLKKKNKFILILFPLIYLTIEGTFLIANLHKFSHGGWFTLAMSAILLFVMFVWFMGREIKKRYSKFVQIADYAQILKDMHSDTTIQKYATNLIYIIKADNKTDVESKVMYSIVNKMPKRADMYWLIHVHYVNEPKTLEYTVDQLIPNVLTRIEFRLGFQIEPKLNLFFRQVIEDMVKSKEYDFLSNYPSLRKHKIPGEFRFVYISRIKNKDLDLSNFDKFIMFFYDFFGKTGTSDIEAFGLDTSNVTIEKVPMYVKTSTQLKLKRIRT
jgi:KUP system potassium uptake protein